MKAGGSWLLCSFVALGLLGLVGAAPMATPRPAPSPTSPPAATPSTLLKAKQEAEARGYIFETNHDEIVAKARQEGKLSVLNSLNPKTSRAMKEAFTRKYPFIDVHVEEITGHEGAQRFLLELQSGTVKEWDIAHANSDFYNETLKHSKKFDIKGMAEQGVLAIDPRIVDPNYRSSVSEGSLFVVVAYNKKLISPDKVPNTWEDFLKPEFSGKKFLVDIGGARRLAALAPLLGEEWVVDYARKTAAQHPIWGQGATRMLTAMAAGEHSLYPFAGYQSCVRARDRDPTSSLVCKIIEPVPTWLMEHEFVVNTAPHPYAGLLWLEFQASPEGQVILDELEPLKSSLYAGGKVAQAIAGLKVSVNDFKTFEHTPRWSKMIVEAWGFPKANVK